MTWIPTATLFLMMVSLGMTLRPEDFRRIATAPAAVVVGMTGQLVLLPVVAFALAWLFGLSPTLAIGLVLIAACPGGVVSNALSQLARGDLALSVTLTALSSLVSFVTVPFVVALAFEAFGGEERQVALSFVEMAATLFGTTVLPVLLGMAVLRVRPAAAERLHRPLLTVSTSVLMLMIVGLFVSLSRSDELSMAQLVHHVTPALVALVAITMAAGALGARLFGLSGATARTITIEIGVQNVNLALVVAVSLLGEQRYGGPAVIYMPVMFAFAGVVILLGRRAEAKTAPEPAVSR